MLALIGSLAAGDVESGRASWLIVAISLILSTLLAFLTYALGERVARAFAPARNERGAADDCDASR